MMHGNTGVVLQKSNSQTVKMMNIKSDKETLKIYYNKKFTTIKLSEIVEAYLHTPLDTPTIVIKTQTKEYVFRSVGECYDKVSGYMNEIAKHLMK